MSAYIISDVTIRDAAAIEQYRSPAAASIARHGGRYIVRGGAMETLEGDWHPNIIVVELPDAEAARRWYRSPEICGGARGEGSGARPQADHGRGREGLDGARAAGCRLQKRNGPAAWFGAQGLLGSCPFCR